MQGTVNTRLEGLLVERCDGNAVMLSGFNRNASILHSEIRWTGDSARPAHETRLGLRSAHS